jgi:hypothetical protein
MPDSINAIVKNRIPVMYRPIDKTWAAYMFEAEEEEKITPKVTIKTDITCIAVYLQKKRRK